MLCISDCVYACLLVGRFWNHSIFRSSLTWGIGDTTRIGGGEEHTIAIGEENFGLLDMVVNCSEAEADRGKFDHQKVSRDGQMLMSNGVPGRACPQFRRKAKATVNCQRCTHCATIWPLPMKCGKLGLPKHSIDMDRERRRSIDSVNIAQDETCTGAGRSSASRLGRGFTMIHSPKRIEMTE